MATLKMSGLLRRWNTVNGSYHRRPNLTSLAYSTTIPLFKKKVAISIGYVGTNFRGLQQPKTRLQDGSQTPPQPDLPPTIEFELERALHEAGCISSLNLGDLDRLGWSRMARTDKGVHAAFNVVSGNLVIETKPPQELLAGTRKLTPFEIEKRTSDFVADELERMRSTVNKTLPPEIRCWGLSKVPSGFRAQMACDWREYEYVLPSKLIHESFQHSTEKSKYTSQQILHNKDGVADNDKSVPLSHEEKLRLFQEALKMFEGTNSYHNFTKSSALKKVIKNSKNKKDRNEEKFASSSSGRGGGGAGPKSDAPGVFNEAEFINVFNDPNKINDVRNTKFSDEDVEFEDELQEGQEEDDEEDEEEEEEDASYRVSDREEADLTRLNMSKLAESNRTVTECRMMDQVLTIDGTDYYRVRVRGSSFLYNQIRLMVGGAVAVARGTMPLWSLEAALKTSYAVRIPLAPATGLFLNKSSFETYDNANMSLYARDASPGVESAMMHENDDEVFDFSAYDTMKRQRNNSKYSYYTNGMSFNRGGGSGGGKYDSYPQTRLRSGAEKTNVVLVKNKAEQTSWLKSVLYPHIASQWQVEELEGKQSNWILFQNRFRFEPSSSFQTSLTQNKEKELLDLKEPKEEKGESRSDTSNSLVTNNDKDSTDGSILYESSFQTRSLEEYQNIWNETKSKLVEQELKAECRDLERRKYFVQQGRETLDEMNQQREEEERRPSNGKGKGSGKGKGKGKGKGHKKGGLFMPSIKDILPRKFATEMAIRYGSDPNLFAVQKILCDEIMNGTIPHDSSQDALFDFVDQHLLRKRN